MPRWIGTGLLAIMLALSTGCGAAASMRAAERRAGALLHAAYPGPRYVRACASRVGGGYVFTFRSVHEPNVEHADSPPWPVVVVPDSGEPRHLAEVPAVGADGVRIERWRADSGGLDSATAVGAARAMAPAGATLHCVLPLSGGAWVQFLTADDGSAASPALSGTVVAVGADGQRAVVGRF